MLCGVKGLSSDGQQLESHRGSYSYSAILRIAHLHGWKLLSSVHAYHVTARYGLTKLLASRHHS
eukprot:3999387-Amphidinium_carterae.1